MFSSTSLELRSMNTACFLGHYTHALGDSVAQVLPMVPENARTLLPQAVSDRRDASKVRDSMCAGLDRFTGQSHFLVGGLTAPLLAENWLFWGCPSIVYGHGP